MASPQFQIPNQETQVSVETIREIDAIFDTPEMLEAVGEFSEIKKIERMLDELHLLATRENLPKLNKVEAARKRVMQYFVTSDAIPSLDDELTEVESKLGGSVVPIKPGVFDQRLWAHKDTRNNEYDWFYRVQDTAGTMTARYKFTDTRAEKLVDGRPTPFYKSHDVNEEMNVKILIPQAFNAIYNGMYASIPLESLKSAKQSRADDYDLAA